MLNKFIDYINTQQLLSANDKIVLGVSGGIDSMAMLNLFTLTNYRIAVAHCNFGLRKEESDTDQEFVKNECDIRNILFHHKIFKTKEYGLERGISIQMAARELRYLWFEELSSELGFSCIGIAHNKNDLAETFLINLSRGTGLRGLSGIKPKNGKIIRPLLFATRDEINVYTRECNIAYREDSSNSDIKYKRNRIRLKIIPEFENLSPSFVSGIAQTANRLNEAEMIFSQTIDYHFGKLYHKTEQGGYFVINELALLQPLHTFLFEFLKKWKFPKESVPGIISSLKSSSGKQFFSQTHRLVKDRDKLIISPLPEEGITRYYIDEETKEISLPVRLKICIVKKDPGFVIPTSSSVACLDLHLLNFPLILRKWEKGDYFQPLGMSGLKKVSDYFIDNKFSLIDKENTWLIASGNKIAWIAGHRLDDRFRISDRTREILLIELVR